MRVPLQEPMPDPTAEPTQTPDLPEDPPPTQQPETELFPETAADNGQLAVLKAQLENLLADETRLKAEIDTTADPSDQLASLRSQRRSTERSISNVNDQIDAMEDSAQIAEDIQKKQSQIDNLQAQINALSAKEEKIDSLSGQIEKAIEDINTANFDLETQRIALETLETNHSAQVSKTEANQATQSQIGALTVETLNNAIENAQAEIRACLKIVNTLNRRAFFRRAAMLCLEIHKVFLRQIALPGEKIPCRWAYCQFSNGA